MLYKCYAKLFVIVLTGKFFIFIEVQTYLFNFKISYMLKISDLKYMSEPNILVHDGCKTPICTRLKIRTVP